MHFKLFRIGKYEFLEPIGSKGIANVLRVKSVGAGRFEKEFAVKRILPSF